jgi:hypothetical protein
MRACLRAGNLVAVPLAPTWLRTGAGMPPRPLLQAMANAPTRMRPDYGLELLDLEVRDNEPGEHPVVVRLRRHGGTGDGEERTVRARYVLEQQD